MNGPVIALVGNPNCGKSTLFNALTGSHQKVGNWPGVTIDCKHGYFLLGQQRVNVVDLPGTYSLMDTQAAEAIDKRIACDYILKQQVDVIVNVVDATHLERHLYLTSQLMDLGRPVILAINMIDTAKRSGIEINFKSLQRELNCLVVPVIANQDRGIETLKKSILRATKNPSFPKTINYSPLIENTLDTLKQQGITRFSALQLLEKNLKTSPSLDSTVQNILENFHQTLATTHDEDVDIIMADARFTAIHGIVQKAVQRVTNKSAGISERIDRIVLHRFLGIPIFLLMMYALFFFAINIGGAFQDFFDISTQALCVDGLAQGLSALGVPPWLNAIITHGLGKGINTTLTFVPVIASMYFFLSLLEASGYMARATFIVDRAMRALGLPGQAFIPLIVGFGCNVPGIMATRHLENQRDRVLTILMSPFMSCSARLAIFAIFTTAFFPSGGHNIVFLLYVIGIAIALLTGFILRHTLLQGQAAPLLLELPSYHIPQFHTLLLSTWARLKHFLWRAGKVIVPVCLVIGVLNSITLHGTLITTEASEQSLLSECGRWLTPLFSPLGVQADNWPATVSLLTGALAKEVVIGTLNTLYSQVGHLNYQVDHFNLWNSLRQALLSIPENLRELPQAFANPILASAPDHSMDPGVYGLMVKRFTGPVGAFAYLLFVLLYMPCVSTIAAIRRELNNAWMWFSVAWSLMIAYGAGLVFYQLATLFSHPISSIVTVLAWLSLASLMVMAMYYYRYEKTVSRDIKCYSN